MSFRTDENNNPAAITTDVAAQGGLLLVKDYNPGTPFRTANGLTLFTAHLVHDPVELTIAVIDRVGYYTMAGGLRWSYVGIPSFVWHNLSPKMKQMVVGFHYLHEGGTALWDLFPGFQVLTQGGKSMSLFSRAFTNEDEARISKLEQRVTALEGGKVIAGAPAPKIGIVPVPSKTVHAQTVKVADPPSHHKK